MQTRKDLYQAHRLMTQRLGMALLQAQPDVPESPMRRQNVATFAGVLIGVLLMAGFGIWGMLKSGGATKLTDPGQLLVEEETGAAYVYSQKERKLLPVANYVTGRLLLDVAAVKVRNVSAASLADFPRGQLVGIQGAPDSLPAKDKMVHGPWAACVTEGKDAAGGTKPYVTLAVRHAPGQTLLLVASGTLLLGLMGSLFARRRRVWFRVSPPEGGSPTSGSSLVEAGGLPRTDHPGFADEFAQLVAAVSDDGRADRRAREGDE